MTVAEKIKKESKNRTFERLMKVLDNAMKWMLQTTKLS